MYYLDYNVSTYFKVKGELDFINEFFGKAFKLLYKKEDFYTRNYLDPQLFLLGELSIQRKNILSYYRSIKIFLCKI